MLIVHFKSFTPDEYRAVAELMKKMDVTVTANALAKGSANRNGEIVFLLDGKDYRTRTVVEQYNYAPSGNVIGDGHVITNQTATSGHNGVNLVFMGDSNKKSIDLPFWYNVSDQTFTNPKMRQCS